MENIEILLSEIVKENEWQAVSQYNNLLQLIETTPANEVSTDNLKLLAGMSDINFTYLVTEEDTNSPYYHSQDAQLYRAAEREVEKVYHLDCSEARLFANEELKRRGIKTTNRKNHPSSIQKTKPKKEKTELQSLISFLREKHDPPDFTVISQYGETCRTLEKLGWIPENNQAGIFYWLFKGEWEKCAEVGDPAIAWIKAVINRYPYIKEYSEKEFWQAFAKYREIHLNAFKALGRIGGEQVIKYIISIAINTRAPMWDSIFATRVLGEIGNAESAKPILKCLKQYINKNELAYGSRVPEFCMTLAKLNEKQAGELVLEAWKRSDSHNDPKPYIIALGLIGDERAVGYISNCIGNKIPDILEKDTSVCGLEALSKIGTKHAIDKLKHFARIYATSNTPEVIFTTLANELRNHGDYEWLIDELITYGLSEHTKSGFGSSGRIVTKLEWITGENLGGKINNWSEWWKENKKLNASITS